MKMGTAFVLLTFLLVRCELPGPVGAGQGKTPAKELELPSLEVERSAQDAEEREERGSDGAVQMLDRVIIKVRPKSVQPKSPPDARLTAMAKLALVADERVQGHDMTVETHNGVVILHGIVDSDHAKSAAEEVAKSVEGVKAVKSLLEIAPPAENGSREEALVVTDRVRAALKKDNKLKKIQIDVKMDAGVITLTGNAPDLLTSAHAAWTAWRVRGVRAVKNDLAVSSRSHTGPHRVE